MLIMIMPNVRQRQKQKLQFQQHSSEESCVSNIISSPPKTHRHRRTSSFVRQLSDEYESGSSISMKSTTIKVMDPLNISGINSDSGSDAPPQGHMMDCNSPRSSKSECSFLGCEDDISLPALELIRELSFGTPWPNKTLKRADTAGTVTSSSSSEMSTDPEDHRHITSPEGLDLKPLRDLRRRSLSPLRGLKYLPDLGTSLYNSGEG